MNRLKLELEKQMMHGHDPNTMPDEERIQLIKDMVIACTDELHEALGEVGWKPWASSRHINRDAYLHELADAQLFLDNLILAVLAPDEDPEALEAEFNRLLLVRIERALKRQLEGYDGVTGKCPGCKRDLGDTPPQAVEGRLFCSSCGKFLGEAA